MRWELTEKAKHGANDLHDSGKSDLTNIRDLFECNFEFQSTRFLIKRCSIFACTWIYMMYVLPRDLRNLKLHQFSQIICPQKIHPNETDRTINFAEAFNFHQLKVKCRSCLNREGNERKTTAQQSRRKTSPVATRGKLPQWTVSPIGWIMAVACARLKNL